MSEMSRISRCPCGHPVCKDWHVGPASVQGVSFTEDEAKAVAILLTQSAAVEAFALLYDARVQIDQLKEFVNANRND